MAGFFVEEGPLIEPNLYGFPGRKPVGPVEIDWSNPLTRDLHSFYFWTSIHGQELTGNIDPALITGATVDPAFEANALRFNRINDEEVLIDGGNEHDFHSANAEYSICGQIQLDPNAPSSGDEYVITTSAASVGSFNVLTMSYDITGGGIYTFVLTRNDTEMKFYIAGILLDTTSTTAGRGKSHLIRYQTNTTSFEVYCGDATSTSIAVGATTQKNTDRWDGWIYFNSHYTRVLSEAEAKSLTRDPYQFLIPA